MVIDKFTGKFADFSNFALWQIDIWTQTFSSNEHAFVFAKNPQQWRDEWHDLTPGQVKRKGRKIDLRPDWDAVRVEIMEEIVLAKFNQYDELRKLLLSTNDAKLVEGNHWHDNFWGDCGCINCFRIGENHLGRILMTVREELKGQHA